MVQPIGNRLLVKPLSGGEVTNAYGIVLKENTEYMTSVKCEVVAAGDTVVRAWPIGTVILAIKQAFTEAKDCPEDKTVIISEDDVLAVIAP